MYGRYCRAMIWRNRLKTLGKQRKPARYSYKKMNINGKCYVSGKTRQLAEQANAGAGRHANGAIVRSIERQKDYAYYTLSKA
ncbi:hypothetical protein VNO77_22216 [Canavalia gladiata]|uniref:Uncharacterized protein n=1 Tax=Canavalia gladiata TaxID=3824 RepID=A0AAN9L268_CANGL